MIFKNTTSLDGAKIVSAFCDAAHPFPTADLDVRVRYSRSSDFSGTCYYATDRLHVNLGKHLTYPYRLDTYIARAVSSRTTWSKPLYSIELADGYGVVLFVLLHEYYHWLVKRAGRNTRRKESMCDRFAARVLHDQHGAIVRDPAGLPVDRCVWDFQDLTRFVAPALLAKPKPRPTPTAAALAPAARDAQLTLFPV